MKSERWGVPTGANPDEYGDITKWNYEQWRWEFLRRRQDVRMSFMFSAREHYSEKYGKDAILPLEILFIDEYLNKSFYCSPSLAANIGYGRLRNPVFSTFAEDDEPNPSLEARTLFPVHIGRPDPGFKIIGIGQVAIVFDPAKALPPQLDGLKDYLSALRNYHVARDPDRIHEKKWFEYLRLLDARASGFTWLRCATLVLDAHSARTPQTARDKHRQARATQSAL